MKNVLITGASSGIGRTLAIALAKHGWQVYAGGRNRERLLTLCNTHDHIHPCLCDITQPNEIERIRLQLPPLDMLFLNAGSCEYIDDAQQFDGKRFAHIINTNLTSVGYCLEGWLGHLKQGGKLVLMSSTAAWLPFPRAEAYGASKAGLSYLARSLMLDLAPKGIHVTLIHPGFVSTPLTDKNNFAMPGIISTEEAVTYIMRGLARNQREINFPPLFAVVLKLLSWLPFRVWQTLMTRRMTK